MKKLIILFTLILSILLCVGVVGYNIFKQDNSNVTQNKAEEKNITKYKFPKEKSQQYKQEMEKIIDDGYTDVIKQIDEDVARAKMLRNKVLRNDYKEQDYYDIGLIGEVSIPGADIYLYAKLMKVTQEKYLGEKYEPIGGDIAFSIQDFLDPYFLANDVSYEKLIAITEYANTQIAIVEQYVKDAEKTKREY